MAWTGELIEAPGCEEDEWQSCVESRSHHRLLALRYGWRYQDHTTSCFSKHLLHYSRYLHVGQAARTLHLFFFRVVKQEAVANDCVALSANGDVELYAKELRVFPSDCQSSRVVLQVVKPTAQFSGAF